MSTLIWIHIQLVNHIFQKVAIDLGPSKLIIHHVHDGLECFKENS